MCRSKGETPITAVCRALPNKQIFPEIQGFRTLLNLWVVLCHCSNVVQHFAFIHAANQDVFLLNYVLRQPWISVCNAFGFQVDVFFVISGFVLTYSMLSKPSLSISPSVSSIVSNAVQALLGCVFMVLKKLLRYYPAMIAMVLLSVWMQDFGTENKWTLLSLFAFPLEANVPISFVILWSNRVDILCSVWLYLCAYCMQYEALATSMSVSLSLVLLSFVPKCWKFFSFSPRLSYLQMTKFSRLADRLIPVSMHPARTVYYRDVLYPNTFDFVPVEAMGGLKGLIIEQEYTVFHQRITPFFIGLALAVAVKQAWQQQSSATKPTKSPSLFSSVAKYAYRGFHLCCLLLSIAVASLPYLVARSNTVDLQQLQRQEEAPFESLPAVPAVADFFVSAAMRPLFAAAFAYLLCRSMLPASHDLHLSLLSSLLRWQPLQWLSTYTYALYVVHMKVLHEVMWRYLPPQTMKLYFGEENVAVQFVVWAGVTYGCSLLCAIAMHHTLEAASEHWAKPAVLWAERRVMQTVSSNQKKKAI